MIAALSMEKGLQDKRDADILAGCLSTHQAEQAAKREGLILERNSPDVGYLGYTSSLPSRKRITPLRHKVGHIARGTLPMMTMIKKLPNREQT